jgi:hypothetical protein
LVLARNATAAASVEALTNADVETPNQTASAARRC